MGHGKNSQKRAPADGSKPETREEKRQRIARTKAKTEEAKKSLPTILVRLFTASKRGGGWWVVVTATSSVVLCQRHTV